MIDHADGGDDGVERKDDVEHRDSHEDGPERRFGSPGIMFGLGMPFDLLVEFRRAFPEEEEASQNKDEILTRNGMRSDRKECGSFNCMTQVMQRSSSIRVTIAKARPRKRAFARCASGSLSTRMEIKTMLSIPSTISMTVSVSRAIQASGLLIHEKSKVVEAIKGVKSVMRCRE